MRVSQQIINHAIANFIAFSFDLIKLSQYILNVSATQRLESIKFILNDFTIKQLESIIYTSNVSIIKRLQSIKYILNAATIKQLES